MQLDLSYANSVPLMLAEHNHIQFIQVGAGGTGGWLIGAIARLMLEIELKTNKTTDCKIIDFDRISEKNIPRQNFQPAEVGLFKAEVLTARYSLALGCKISAIAQPFSKQMISPHWRKLIIIIGCVDNSAARAEISECLNQNYSNRPPNIFWLDCGNHAQSSSGQVLLGSTNQFNLVAAFDNPSHPSFCINLPSPTAQHPEMLQARPE